MDPRIKKHTEEVNLQDAKAVVTIDVAQSRYQWSTELLCWEDT